MSMIYEALLDLHAEMVLDEAIRDFQVSRLYKEIDVALSERDEQTFLSLTNQLRSLKLDTSEHENHANHDTGETAR